MHTGHIWIFVWQILGLSFRDVLHQLGQLIHKDSLLSPTAGLPGL